MIFRSQMFRSQQLFRRSSHPNDAAVAFLCIHNFLCMIVQHIAQLIMKSGFANFTSYHLCHRYNSFLDYFMSQTFYYIINILVSLKLSYGYHVWRPIRSEISKMSAVFIRFIRLQVKNCFGQGSPGRLCEDHSQSIIADWRQKIKEMFTK